MEKIYCGDIDESFIGKFVTLFGWVNRRRKTGDMVFIDLRERECVIQVVVSSRDVNIFNVAKLIRNEFYIQICGQVRSLPAEAKKRNNAPPNKNLEIVCSELKVVSVATKLPILPNANDITERLRLTHRVLDLRSPRMQENIRLRHKIASQARAFFDVNGFIEIETPILTKCTHGGARNYLVQANEIEGQYFALPQSPQVFKQLLMASGFDRYYQVARCFRDEDLRGDRQPEFTHIDAEMSFVTEEEIRDTFEELVVQLFKNAANINLEKFKSMKFADAIKKYGTYKPDLRIALEIIDLSSSFSEVGSLPIRNTTEKHGEILALLVPADVQTMLQTYNDCADVLNSHGLEFWMIASIEGNRVNPKKLLASTFIEITDYDLKTIFRSLNVRDGDILIIGTDPDQFKLFSAFGLARETVVKDALQKNPKQSTCGWYPVWIIDCPLFEYQSKGQYWKPTPHPFTMPKVGHEELIDIDPSSCNGQSFYLIINGRDVGGGGVRVHQSKMQRLILQKMGLSPDVIKQDFGYLLDALDLGAPPHGGMALSLDRLTALLAGVDSIRDVIAFPKSQRGNCLLTGAPNVP